MPTATRPAPKRPVKARPGSALVVEDDPLIALAIADVLAAGGADPVQTCATIAAAMIALDQLQPALVVLDVHLADRSDGWTFAELLPLMGPRRPQIIFATGDPASIPADIAALGTVLVKPFTSEELLDAVQHGRRGSGLMARLRGALKSERV